MSKDNTGYALFVADMFKTEPGDELDKGFFVAQFAMLHAACGISGEAGEVLDVVKKVTFTGKKIDKGALILELGDLEFYLQAMRNAIGVSREEVINANIIKLNDRHPNGFAASIYYEGEAP
jgi:NTP pyrophosphatase (non-canonical NTP hydrolase)